MSIKGYQTQQILQIYNDDQRHMFGKHNADNIFYRKYQYHIISKYKGIPDNNDFEVFIIF